MKIPSLLFANTLLVIGCATGAAGVAGPTLQESFPLRVGQSTVIAKEGLKVGFVSVVSDSRCGKGEMCVWEGDAVVRIWLQAPRAPREQRDLHTASRQPGAASYRGYGIRLVKLSPIRIAERSIAPGAYLATLSVTLGPVDEDGAR